jgi:hypothetical protein
MAYAMGYRICRRFAASNDLLQDPKARSVALGLALSAASQLILFQLPNPLLQELALWFLLGQRQSFLISGPGLRCPAKPAVHICTG